MKEDRDVKHVKSKRGGAVKKAPPGYYTAGEAQKVLGLNASTFGYYVRKGKINRFVPPLRTEGYYEMKEVNQLANDIALFIHTTVQEPTKTFVRIAEAKDTPGIVKVLTDRGWTTATAEQRSSWYKINPNIDYIAVLNNEVVGYIHAVPYTPEALELMMSGKKRSWSVQAEDILPYEKGKTYNVYVGIATRQDIPNHTQRIGFRLISGFLSFIEELTQQQIIIQSLYAVSAEPEGQKLCKDLDFTKLPEKEGDLFPRYCLNLDTSDSHFARRYREAKQNMQNQNL